MTLLGQVEAGSVGVWSAVKFAVQEETWVGGRETGERLAVMDERFMRKP